jgi:predicted nucleic acid-binding protein
VGAVAFDASVVIGFLETTDAHHERAVRELTGWLGPAHSRFMSVATYAEILVHPIRRDTDQVVEDLVRRCDIKLVPIDRELARRCAELRARFEAISLGDAMALATAQRCAAELLTFDDQLGLAADRLL